MEIEEETEADILKDIENLIGNIGGSKGGASAAVSIALRVANFLKRGRQEKNYDQCKNKGSDDLCMENQGNAKPLCKEEGGDGIVIGDAVGENNESSFEGGLVEREENVEMGDNECNVREKENLNDLVEENSSSVLAFEGKDSSGYELREEDVEMGGNVRERESLYNLGEENNRQLLAVKDGDGSGYEQRENGVSCSDETEKAEPRQKEQGIADDKQEGRNMKKEAELENEVGGVLRIRKCSRKAMESIEDEEGFSKKGKRLKGQKREKSSDGSMSKANRVQRKTAQQEDEDGKQRKMSRNVSMGEDEGNRFKMNGEQRCPSRGKKAPQNVPKSRIELKKDENGFLASNLGHCHQCKRKDKGPVVRCTKCKMRRYCHTCMRTWYPKMSEEAFAEACPVCRLICNCKRCLSTVPRQIKADTVTNEDQKVQYSKYIIKVLLPFIEQINREQVMEKELEANIQGISFYGIELEKAACDVDERIYCDNCRTSIADYHRSCPRCSYDLCLSCCRELRGGHLQGGEKEMPFRYVDYGFDYIHGGEKKKDSERISLPTPTIKDNSDDNVSCSSNWKANESGAIHCPLKDKGGCGKAVLKLKCLLPTECVSKLLFEAKEIFNTDREPVSKKDCKRSLELISKLGSLEAWANDESVDLCFRFLSLSNTHELECMPVCSDKSCSCFKSQFHDSTSGNLNKAASRKDSDDNFLYCPSAVDIECGDLKHFQWHWSNGQPVIVTNVLETTLGLSWEPMVMWRALRQKKIHAHDVTAINCLDWSEIVVNIHEFFKWYSWGQSDKKGWPKILKLNGWPPTTLFEKQLPRHNSEFISCLPFKEYTHPRNGYFNLAVKFPEKSLKPDMGPKTYIAYGFNEELVRGDSVTKLHSNMSDVVYVLTHVQAVSLCPEKLERMQKLKERHATQDRVEVSVVQMASGEKEVKVPNTVQNVAGDDKKTPTNAGESPDGTKGGALWDIFRQQDVPELEEYLKKHFKEFRHIRGNLLPQVIHPIHDQTIYLTSEHKRRLKKAYGIEPWTFVQNLGDAVLIPAGCPYQVRNLKSCIKVALEFVSPEHVRSCLQLTEEFRLLPLDHSAKEDKLEVKKMIIHAMSEAVNDVNRLSTRS